MQLYNKKKRKEKMSKKIALLFPGYGSQYVGMGKELYDEYRIVQEYFEEASSCLDINFVKLCFASSDSELGKMANAYTSLFLVGSAVFALLKENGIESDIVAGYNNGESAALFAGGCFSLPDGLYLLNKFASFYQSIVETMDLVALHVMGVTTTHLEEACHKVNSIDGHVFVAIYNNRTDHIIVGNAEKVARIQHLFGSEAGVVIEDASIDVGLHSPLAAAIVVRFKPSLEKVDFKDMRIPLISNIDGKIITDGAESKERFIAHINSPVMMSAVLRRLGDYDIIIVACPGDQLSAMVKSQYPEKTVMTIAKKADLEELKKLIVVEQTVTESEHNDN